MGVPLGFDLDLLRSFVAIAEERSFTRAAARVGRTQSAVSLQMQRLEGLLGQTVIVRGKGGAVELNNEGLHLLERARELLMLNDDIMRSMRSSGTWHRSPGLPCGIVRAFSAAHPRAFLAGRARRRGRSRGRGILFYGSET